MHVGDHWGCVCCYCRLPDSGWGRGHRASVAKWFSLWLGKSEFIASLYIKALRGCSCGTTASINQICFLKYTTLTEACVCGSESVRERGRERERFDSPTVSLQDCLCLLMSPLHAFLFACNSFNPRNNGKIPYGFAVCWIYWISVALL